MLNQGGNEMKNHRVEVFKDSASCAWKYQLWQGILFIAASAAVLVFPTHLVVIAASCFMGLGLVFLISASSLKRFRRQYDVLDTGFEADELNLSSNVCR